MINSNIPTVEGAHNVIKEYVEASIKFLTEEDEFEVLSIYKEKAESAMKWLEKNGHEYQG